uniref:Uncharacterized protein AlNc14C437G11632 n=1 Tax=Albugo laibachii Nc14 TaxID=890382 RepID=F0WZP1_9STRA|nr:hypothetical protein ALNC14_131110 [Albugo laibachii Nc14]|eukprot:CCA26967.1 hypothetical protein ALNC14_131110 [Albugo laibachii Nc14]
MTIRRKLYTNEAREAAVTRIIAGETIAAVSQDTKIPAITLKRYKKLRRAGQLSPAQWRGTKPTLPPPIENDLVLWISAMQRSVGPMGLEQILQKVNQIHHRLHGSTCLMKDLTAGWYRSFRKRHTELSARVAQKVSHARDSVGIGDLRRLFHTLAKLVVENKLQLSQIFNMDETSFESRSKMRDRSKGLHQRRHFPQVDQRLCL